MGDLTVVIRLGTDEFRLYSLPPIQAVRVAHYQAEGDWNWWSYDTWVMGAPTLITKTSRFIACGDWCAAMTPEDNEALLRRYVYPVWARLDAQERTPDARHPHRPTRPARPPRPQRRGHSPRLPGL